MATTPYLDLDGYKSLALLPVESINDVDAANPGWFAATLVERSSFINARLAKRYNVPFASPYPEVVQGWLARLVDRLALKKRGYVPTDVSAIEVIDDEKQALAEIQEAADAVDGKFDLPLRADLTASGIARGGPRAYSEASPYVHRDRQGPRGRREDANRRGT